MPANLGYSKIFCRYATCRAALMKKFTKKKEAVSLSGSSHLPYVSLPNPRLIPATSHHRDIWVESARRVDFVHVYVLGTALWISIPWWKDIRKDILRASLRHQPVPGLHGYTDMHVCEIGCLHAPPDSS